MVVAAAAAAAAAVHVSVLHNYPADRLSNMESFLNRTTFLELLRQFAHQHTSATAINGTSPWIGEDLHPDEGYWVARFMMYMINGSTRNRGKCVALLYCQNTSLWFGTQEKKRCVVWCGGVILLEIEKCSFENSYLRLRLHEN